MNIKLTALTALCLSQAACSILPPIEAAEPRRLSLEWSEQLYPGEALPYFPREEGQLAFVRDAQKDILLSTSRDRKLRAYVAASGKRLWETSLKAPISAQPLDLSEAGFPGEVLVATLEGKVFRLRLSDGSVVWKSRHPGRAGITARPLVIAGAEGQDAKVIVSSQDNRVTALALSTGERLWEYERFHDAELSITGQAGVSFIANQLVTGFSDGHLVALSPEDGSVLWASDLSNKARTFADVDTTPVAVNIGEENLIVAASFASGLVAVGADDGIVRWSVPGEGFTTPTELDGIIYASQATGYVLAIDADTGNVRWRLALGSWAGQPTLSRKYVIVPTGDALALIDRGSGRHLLQWNDNYGVTSTPEVAFGNLFVLSNGGSLYRLGLY